MDGFRPKDLFAFSRRERRGVYVLLVILLLVLLGRMTMRVWITSSRPVAVDSVSIREVDAWLRSARHQEGEQPKGEASPLSTPTREKQAKLFPFDPNLAGRKELSQLGFGPRQINTLLNYRSKGGRFYQKSDLTRIYGIDQSDYERVKDHIFIAREDEGERVQPGRGTKQPSLDIELNAADTFQLTRLPGIGPVYARRICKYRNLLGGYANPGQILEVYGIDSSLFEAVSSYIHVDTLRIRTIDLNNTSFSSLIRHPYLREYHTRAILHYIDFRGKLESTNELLDNNILDAKTYKKMKPYLKVDR